MLKLKEKDLEKIIIIGDRVLIRPAKPKNRTDSGLYLPQGVHKKEELYTGYVIKVGPGYPIPSSSGRRRTLEGQKRRGKICSFATA